MRKYRFDGTANQVGDSLSRPTSNITHHIGPVQPYQFGPLWFLYTLTLCTACPVTFHRESATPKRWLISPYYRVVVGAKEALPGMLLTEPRWTFSYHPVPKSGVPWFLIAVWMLSRRRKTVHASPVFLWKTSVVVHKSNHLSWSTPPFCLVSSRPRQQPPVRPKAPVTGAPAAPLSPP